MNWKPTASLKDLGFRDLSLRKAREYFYQTQTLEVDVGALSEYQNLDRFIGNLEVSGKNLGKKLFLQTSPEYYLKRFITAYKKDCFYLGKSYRDDAISNQHRFEFTMLEWYRINYNLDEITADTINLIQSLFNPDKFLTETLTYQEIFNQLTKIGNILTIDSNNLQQFLAQNKVPISAEVDDKELLESIIWDHFITPFLKQEHHQNTLFVIKNFPSYQDSLAKIDTVKPLTHKRFEIYFRGYEIANGYEELDDYQEHLTRFKAQQSYAAQENKELLIDQNFLSAIKQGLPPSSGVALGFDRLLMAYLNKTSIQEVMPF